jgi:cholesterol transport system auxiliary component
MRHAVALCLAVAACGPLVQIGGNAAPPDSLLTLRADGSAPAATNGAPILIALPTLPGALRTLRIPVTTTATEIAYLQAATWVEQPNQLFQRLLADVVQARSGRPVVDERTDAGATHRLSGRLAEFGLDVRDGRMVRVRYDAVLTASAGGFVASRSFEATAPVAVEAGPEVAAALNAAANDVARQVSDWIVAPRS